LDSSIPTSCNSIFGVPAIDRAEGDCAYVPMQRAILFRQKWENRDDQIILKSARSHRLTVVFIRRPVAAITRGDLGHDCRGRHSHTGPSAPGACGVTSGIASDSFQAADQRRCIWTTRSSVD
jgi:hypothetical protein